MSLDSKDRCTCDRTGEDLTGNARRIALGVDNWPPRTGEQPPTMHFRDWTAAAEYCAEQARTGPLHCRHGDAVRSEEDVVAVPTDEGNQTEIAAPDGSRIQPEGDASYESD